MARRGFAGWVAVGLSTLASAFWAFWGSIEAFHEGWAARGWLENVAGLLAYLSPMFIVMALALLSIIWRRLGPALNFVVAALTVWFLDLHPSVFAVLAVPLFAVAGLYFYGRPEPRRWALRIIVGIPLVTAIVCGAYPGWLAVTRQDDGDYGLRIIDGNGVRLAWAPRGPGWADKTANWNEAQDACEHLSRDGSRLESLPVRVWRLPTVDEAVRSAVRRGRNAGGEWEARSRRARYRVPPNKETPLWTRYSQAMYRWTSTEAGSTRAYRVVWNGYANTLTKTVRVHFRCVADPALVSTALPGEARR